MPPQDALDTTYLAYQYADADRLRIRYETHARYSEKPNDFLPWVLAFLDLRPGVHVLDAGCGPGAYHRLIRDAGGSLTAIDASSGMLRAAATAAPGGALSVAQASADALPFRAGVFDRAMANHMLYHVPDIEGAVRELRRVVRRGGRIVMATNAAAYQLPLREAHARAAAACGYVAAPTETARFTLDDLPLVRGVFPAARLELREDALVFRDADAPLRYYASFMVDEIVDRPADASHRTPMLAALRRDIEALIARDGVFRVPKLAGCFVAEA